MTFDFAEILTGFIDFLWASFLLLAPMLLFGLFLSGLIHILISRHAILKWLRDDNLKSVSTSAAIGVPIPALQLLGRARRRRDAEERRVSFVLLVFFNHRAGNGRRLHSGHAGIFRIRRRPCQARHQLYHCGHRRPLLHRSRKGQPRRTQSPAHSHCDHGDAHEPLLPGSDDCYISPAQLKASLFAYLRRIGDKISRRENASYADANALDFVKICKHVLRYGFVEVADDILFALVVGVALGGVLYLALPSDLMANEYARWLAYPVMVLVGMPLYICASASTPIAAALVAKGVSPGAALIFLMTGPASNTGTIAIIASQFGTRFASVYVAAVIAVTVVIGISIDAILIAFGATLSVNLAASHSATLQLVQWGGAFALIALIVWRFRAGGLKSGYRDLLSNLRPCREK